jgi:hypothetical protein
MQLNIFVSNFLAKFWVLVEQQFPEGFMSFIGKLIYAYSDLVVYFIVSLSLEWLAVMIICLLCICGSFLIYITEFIISK